jgi:glyceraldehyde 3-phosphate dehydrogenase
MTVRVGINGFGRIGRNILRAIAEAGRKDVEVVAINDLGPVETNAHLLRYDSVHGRFPGQVTVKGDTISVGNGAIKVTAERDPTKLPWKDLGIDIAMECTGIFTAKEKASAHLTAGAKRVLVSAPADGADFTVVFGVNHDKLTKDHKVVSNGSCTTNCLAPVAKGKLDGVSIRVPTPNVSVIDLKIVAKKQTTKEEINDAVKRAAEQQLKGILNYTNDPNVSIDFNHDPHSSTFHMDQTKVINGTLVRVMSWYDNEWGFSNRMADTAVAMGKLL